MIRTARLAFALALAATLVLAASAGAKPQRLPKGWAKQNHVGASQASRDTDRDGLSNWGEWRSGTDPRKRDTDHDGVRDGAEDRDRDGLRNSDEVALGADPRKRDSDHDGVRDGRDDFDVAGRVTSLSGSTLTLRLEGGATVRARVSADSELTCGADTTDDGTVDDGVEADASQVEDDGGDAGDDAGDDTGADDTGDPGADDGGAADDAPLDDPCAGELHVGAEVEGALAASPGGLTVASLDVL